MKVAYILSGDPNNMKGMAINVHEKAKRLKAFNDDDLDITFFIKQYSNTLLFSLLKGNKKQTKKSYTKIDGLVYNNIWIKRSFFNYFKTFKMKSNAIMSRKHLDDKVKDFKGFDLILSHGFQCNYLAFKINQKYNTPFITSWHGSDINVYPFSNKNTFILIKSIIETANLNQFVSNKLLEKSNEITIKGNKRTLYTGVSDLFYRRENNQINEQKKKFKVSNKKVIGFVGNLKPIKNIESLPLIYQKIIENYKDVCLLIIGDGELKNDLKKKLSLISYNFKFFGDIPHAEVSKLMSLIDVLILPSLNEGMPRVIIEALSSGVNVVASNVGGVPEILEKENYFDLDESFTTNISNRIIELLNTNEMPKPLDNKFKWDKTIAELTNTYKKVINTQ